MSVIKKIDVKIASTEQLGFLILFLYPATDKWFFC